MVSSPISPPASLNQPSDQAPTQQSIINSHNNDEHSNSVHTNDIFYAYTNIRGSHEL